MSDLPPQGRYPYPSNYGGQNNVGFGGQLPPGQAPGYSPYPQGGSGYPASPAPSNAVPYPVTPGDSSPYSPPSNTSSIPYPGSSPYPAQPGVGSSYPPQPGVGSSPYPFQPGVNSSPYPPQPGVGSSPYPPQPGVGSSPYPPQPGVGPSPYPSLAHHSPYPAYRSAQAPVPHLNIAPTSTPYQQSATMHQNYSTPVASQPYHCEQSSSSSYSGSMWPYQERPTIRPNTSFDPSMDASALRQAMKGFGTNEAAIAQILSRRTNQQRQRIIQGYQQSYGKDLIKELRSELSGDFLNVVEALMTPLPEFLAKEIKRAVQGIGTKERVLVEILCTSDNTTLRAIKASYHGLFGKPVEADLTGDTSGNFERLLVAMAAASRDEVGLNPSLAPGLAQTLYASGEKRLGTDEVEFLRILSTNSYPLLRSVFEEYRKVSGGRSFESAIRSELSGDFEVGMLAIYECINNRATFFARRLQDAMKGMGTQDNNLIRIIVWRSEIDLGNIKDEFKKVSGKTLEDAISRESSGGYKKILLALIQE